MYNGSYHSSVEKKHCYSTLEKNIGVLRVLVLVELFRADTSRSTLRSAALAPPLLASCQAYKTDLANVI